MFDLIRRLDKMSLLVSYFSAEQIRTDTVDKTRRVLIVSHRRLHVLVVVLAASVLFLIAVHKTETIFGLGVFFCIDTGFHIALILS